MLEGWLELRRYLLRDGLLDGGDEIRPRQQRELGHRLLHRGHRLGLLKGFKRLLGSGQFGALEPYLAFA